MLVHRDVAYPSQSKRIGQIPRDGDVDLPDRGRKSERALVQRVVVS